MKITHLIQYLVKILYLLINVVAGYNYRQASERVTLMVVY